MVTHGGEVKGIVFYVLVRYLFSLVYILFVWMLGSLILCGVYVALALLCFYLLFVRKVSNLACITRAPHGLACKHKRKARLGVITSAPALDVFTTERNPYCA